MFGELGLTRSSFEILFEAHRLPFLCNLVHVLTAGGNGVVYTAPARTEGNVPETDAGSGMKVYMM